MPVAYKLTIDVGASQAMALDVAERLVLDTTRRTLNRAIVLTPVDTGLLRANNDSRVVRGRSSVTGEVFNNTRYADAVHNGTKAYTVRPRSKKALRWTSKSGEVVFATRARIPARRGRPWLLDALKEIAVPDGFVLSGI